MPKRIFIIALLFCLGGISSIYSVIYGLFNEHLNINLAVLMLPVGIGLFKGKSSSRWWARFWFILGYIFIGVMIVASIMSPESLSANLLNLQLKGKASLPYVWSFCAVYLLCVLICHRLLYSAKADKHFNRPDSSGLADISASEPEPNLRRENALEHQLYKQFLRECPDTESLDSKQRHEEYRKWKAQRTRKNHL